MKFLKKKDLFGKIPPISGMLHKHLATQDPPRPIKNMHASDLTKEDEVYCPREKALMMKTLKKGKSFDLTTSLAVTFQIGRDLQDQVAHWLADVGIVWGDWKCLGCNQLHTFCQRPMQCKCGCENFKPEEMRFKSKEAGISCGVDLMVKFPQRTKLTPIEIKTIDKDQFKKLAMPLAEHRHRTTLYLRIIADSDHPAAAMTDTSEGIVFYVSKGGYGCAQDWLKGSLIYESFSPFKEYRVTRNDDSVQEVWDNGVGLFNYIQNGVFPKGICPSSLSKRAKECHVSGPCFSGKYPAGGKACS